MSRLHQVTNVVVLAGCLGCLGHWADGCKSGVLFESCTIGCMLLQLTSPQPVSSSLFPDLLDTLLQNMATMVGNGGENGHRLASSAAFERTRDTAAAAVQACHVLPVMHSQAHSRWCKLLFAQQTLVASSALQLPGCSRPVLCHSAACGLSPVCSTARRSWPGFRFPSVSAAPVSPATLRHPRPVNKL